MAKTISIHKANLSDVNLAAELQCMLWPGHTLEEMQHEANKSIASGDGALFIARIDNIPVGFAECRLRRDYVEGAHTSPVGYLEGIFVRPENRCQGVALKLIQQCEQWAKSRGCFEFASDCELANTESIAFHSKVGFNEINRIVCFTKSLP